MSNQYIEITVGRYQQLLKAEDFLDALEAAGVDNWDGYSIACAMVDEEDEEDL